MAAENPRDVSGALQYTSAMDPPPGEKQVVLDYQRPQVSITRQEFGKLFRWLGRTIEEIYQNTSRRFLWIAMLLLLTATIVLTNRVLADLARQRAREQAWNQLHAQMMAAEKLQPLRLPNGYRVLGHDPVTNAPVPTGNSLTIAANGGYTSRSRVGMTVEFGRFDVFLIDKPDAEPVTLNDLRVVVAKLVQELARQVPGSTQFGPNWESHGRLHEEASLRFRHGSIKISATVYEEPGSNPTPTPGRIVVSIRRDHAIAPAP